MIAKRSVAPAWEKWDGTYRTQWRPVMDWLLRHARVEPGMRILDLACGSGQPAIPAAEKVRPGGRVVGIDTDPAMLSACSRLARLAGADNLELHQMDMHALNFPEGTFDAVTFGFGLMFARDPVKVMLEVRRVLRPGGRFALAVWDEPKRNSLFTIAFDALDALGPRPAPDPKAPGPFRLASHGELQSVIRAAGFQDFTVESVPMNIDAATPEQLWEMTSEMSSILSSAIDDQPDAAAKVKQAFVDEAGKHLHEGHVRLQVTPLCATAMR